MPNKELENFSLRIARRAVKIVIFIGMFTVLLMMINIYVLLNQITATAQINKQMHTLEAKITELEK